MHTLAMTWTLARAALRSELAYRANFLMVSAGLVYQCTGFAFIWVVLSRFDAIAGWTLAEITFLYGVRLTAHGLWVVPGNRLVRIDETVTSGEFDQFLVRPLNPLILLVTSRFWLGSFGDLVGGVVILAAATALVDVDWSPVAVGYLLLAVVGGALLEFSVQLAGAALTFRMLSTFALRMLLDSAFNMFGNYPLRIFGGVGQFLLTFVLPVAFVAYLPASVLLDRTGELHVAPALAYAAPVAGMLAFTLAYLFWRRQLRAYQSAGH